MKLLILINNDQGLYSFRRELLERILQDGHTLYVSFPDGSRRKEIEAMGCRYLETKVDRRGMNPFADLALLRHYRRLLREVRPDAVLTYTVKPNIYGGIACTMGGIPYFANVTGLGDSIENDGILQKLVLGMYRIGLRRARMVFFQNRSNMRFMRQKKVVSGACRLLPGSGVNLEKNRFEPYPQDNGAPVFLTIGRILRDKGIGELLTAARTVKAESPAVTFYLIGSYDQDYRAEVEAAVQDGILNYPGFQDNVHFWIRQSWAIIHPSYHEGMSNVMMEAAASGRPVIATDVPGCREIFEDGVSGVSCKPRDAESLTNAIRRFLSLPYEKKAAMGAAGRKKMEQEFDRNQVVQAYMDEINQIMGDAEI